MTKTLGDVRRRAAGGRAARREPDQAGTRRLGDPDPQRRGRPRGRHRGRGVRLRAALSLLPAVLGPRAAADDAQRRRSRARATNADERDPARPPPGLQDAPDHRGAWSTAVVSSRWAAMFGRSIITGLARLDGRAVAADGERPLSSTAARGRRTPARRSSASSTSPRPSTCRSSTCATARAS